MSSKKVVTRGMKCVVSYLVSRVRCRRIQMADGATAQDGGISEGKFPESLKTRNTDKMPSLVVLVSLTQAAHRDLLKNQIVYTPVRRTSFSASK